MWKVRNATLDDAARLVEIYDYYVQKTAITFEYQTPSVSQFQERMTTTLARYPYLVVEKDQIVQGFAYAGPMSSRPAYDWSCELTIYLDPNAQKNGMGRGLYAAMEKILKAMGIINLYACVAIPEVDDAYLNMNSANFHQHLGYIKVGQWNQCGYKFGNWYHIWWMEKQLGEHPAQPIPVIPYPKWIDSTVNRVS